MPPVFGFEDGDSGTFGERAQFGAGSIGVGANVKRVSGDVHGFGLSRLIIVLFDFFFFGGFRSRRHGSILFGNVCRFAIVDDLIPVSGFTDDIDLITVVELADGSFFGTGYRSDIEVGSDIDDGSFADHIGCIDFFFFCGGIGITISDIISGCEFGERCSSGDTAVVPTFGLNDFVVIAHDSDMAVFVEQSTRFYSTWICFGVDAIFCELIAIVILVCGTVSDVDATGFEGNIGQTGAIDKDVFRAIGIDILFVVDTGFGFVIAENVAIMPISTAVLFFESLNNGFVSFVHGLIFSAVGVGLFFGNELLSASDNFTG